MEILGQLKQKKEYVEPEILVSQKLKNLLDTQKEVDIEIGFGKGAFILGKAILYKDINFIGYEVKKKFVDSVNQKIDKENINNVYVEKNYAEKAIPKQIPNQKIRYIYINFPDPWWKAKHKKRRILQDNLIDTFYNALKMNGRIYFRTDVEEYANTVDDIFSLDKRFKTVEHDIIEDGVLSNREKNYKNVGVPVHYRAFEKIN